MVTLGHYKNKNLQKKTFDEQTIEAVWNKAKIQPGFTSFRSDVCGTDIQRSEYGKESKYGWEIDHINPGANGGTDDLSNLQPLHWETNMMKADTYPWKCPG